MATAPTWVCGQVEHQASQEGEEQAGDDDVDDEVEGKALHDEVVGDVQVGGGGAACVEHPVLPAPRLLDHPFSALHEVAQVWLVALLRRRSETLTAQPCHHEEGQGFLVSCDKATDSSAVTYLGGDLVYGPFL